jgi:beta-phosphoglucomutase
MKAKAVIFDLDGVLIDSAEPHHQSWRLLAKELGQDVTAEQFAASFGRQNRDIIPMLFGPDLDDRVGELSARKEELYRELVRGRLPAIPGGAELVGECRRAGLKLAIGSSTPRANIDLALDELGLADCFDVIVSDADVARGKPDPEVFLTAARRLGVPPRDCVVIEDAPSGVQAALAAGMKVVGLTTQHPPERLAQAHLVVDQLTGLSWETILFACQ